METWKEYSVEEYAQGLRESKTKTYTEPKIATIIRDGSNYAVQLEGRDYYITYTQRELYRNFPEQTGGFYGKNANT